MKLDPGACHGLLVDVVYHAIRDWRTLNANCERKYADDDHRAICNSRGFDTGKEELESFFDSIWFYRICDEFNDLSADDIRDGLHDNLEE